MDQLPERWGMEREESRSHPWEILTTARGGKEKPVEEDEGEVEVNTLQEKPGTKQVSRRVEVLK